MSVLSAIEVATHIGHEVEVVSYANGQNVAIECVDCSEVIVDFEEEI